jgi:hypothetical protein
MNIYHRFPLLACAALMVAGLLSLLLFQPGQSAGAIHAPATSSVVSGLVTVQGTADHPAFRKWQVDLVLEGEEDRATFLALGEEPVVNGDLFAWDTALYPDGNHQLRLRVVHTNLNYDEYFVPVILRNGRVREEPPKAIEPEPAPASDVKPAPASVMTPPDAERWIEIDISDQRLIAWENGEIRFDYTVSTGKPGFRTLPGTFNVYRKYEETRMRGYDYDTPDVPWTMYYSGGFAIHGAYWHDDFGTPVSHGCVNLPVDQAKALYEWADMGITVVVNE